MTVSEMIIELQKQEPDNEVVVRGFDGSIFGVDNPEEIKFENSESYGITPNVVALDLYIHGRRKE